VIKLIFDGCQSKGGENRGLLNYLRSMLTRIYTARYLAKGLIIGIVGCTILVIGVVMMVLPTSAFIAIPIGFGILATEFAWERRLLRKVEEKIRGQTGKAENNENQSEK
jgi:hypothetical protein